MFVSRLDAVVTVYIIRAERVLTLISIYVNTIY